MTLKHIPEVHVTFTLNRRVFVCSPTRVGHSRSTKHDGQCFVRMSSLANDDFNKGWPLFRFED